MEEGWKGWVKCALGSSHHNVGKAPQPCQSAKPVQYCGAYCTIGKVLRTVMFCNNRNKMVLILPVFPEKLRLCPIWLSRCKKITKNHIQHHNTHNKTAINFSFPYYAPPHLTLTGPAANTGQGAGRLSTEQQQQQCLVSGPKGTVPSERWGCEAGAEAGGAGPPH